MDLNCTIFTIVFGLVKIFIQTFTQVWLVEKAGRRPLLLGGMVAMVIALIAMTVALVLQSKVEWLSYISIVTMVVFVVGFAIGLGMYSWIC